MAHISLSIIWADVDGNTFFENEYDGQCHGHGQENETSQDILDHE